jgi:succinyl-CoA synthetase beta subunit
MKLHEYQAKQLLHRYGIEIPRGWVVSDPADAARRAAQLGGRCVLKAQVYAGGRGKAGGVQCIDDPAQAGRVAETLLRSPLVTAQTGPQGLPVNSLLVEERVPVARELYLSLTLDRTLGRYGLIASADGGVDIEQTARTAPERIQRLSIDPLLGLRAFQARDVALVLGLAGPQAEAAVRLMLALYRCFQERDCLLAEINPLVVAEDGRLLAMDAKVGIDDNALFRQPELAGWRDDAQFDPLEVRAARADIAYIKLDGRIGCLVNGAGLAMATLDMLTECGGRPANFLDVGGSADHDKVTEAFRVLLQDGRVEGIFVNIFGGIMRCDLVAGGLIAAAEEASCRLPVVVRMAGARQEEGRRLLEASGLDVEWVDGLAAAAARIVRRLS